jgi:hypothetical protein
MKMTVLCVGQTFAGRVHEKTIADTVYAIPPGYAVSGYVLSGLSPERVSVMQPAKKPEGMELMQEQK